MHNTCKRQHYLPTFILINEKLLQSTFFTDDANKLLNLLNQFTKTDHLI